MLTFFAFRRLLKGKIVLTDLAPPLCKELWS
jgi:hypothetical protein